MADEGSDRPGTGREGDAAVATVAGRYPDPRSAREALSALERAGIEAAKVEVTGAAAQPAVRPGQMRGRDMRVAGQVGNRVLVGGLIGTLVGGIVGLTTGILVFGLFKLGGLGLTVLGLIAGGVVGAFVAGVGGIQVNPDAEATYAPASEGPVQVRVSSGDPVELRRAAEILRQQGATTVERA